MPLRKKTYRKKRNLGKTKKNRKSCPYCKRKYSKTTHKKKTTRRKKYRGGSQITYYKYNNQTPAPRDFLTSSRIHGCSGGAKKYKRKYKTKKKHLKGGNSKGMRGTLIPQDIINLGRGVGDNFNGIKSGFLGVDSQPSPYPTKDQPIDHSITGKFSYTPTNIKQIRTNAEREVGKL